MSKLKKVLFCDSNIDGTIGGSYYSLLYLVDGVDKALYDPLVVFYNNNQLIPTYNNAGIKTAVFDVPRPIHMNKGLIAKIPLFNKLVAVVQSAINFFRFFLWQAIKYAFYLKKHNFELVHLNNSVMRSHNWMLACLLTGTKCVCHERGINTHFSKLARFFIKRLDAVICISDAVRDNMMNHGIAGDNLIKIYNGLDPLKVVVKKTANEIRDEFNIKESEPLIGIVGNIKSWKGQEVVVKAVSIAKKKYPNIKCLLVGDTAESDQPYHEQILQTIASLGLEDNIIFTGYQSNVPDFMNAMDIVIHASTLGEPFGRVLLEAMALKKPLIGARGGAVPEIIQYGETGYMFEPGNHEDLAEHILKIFEHYDNARKLGEAGLARLNSVFHIDLNVVQTQQVYDGIFKTTSSR